MPWVLCMLVQRFFIFQLHQVTRLNVHGYVRTFENYLVTVHNINIMFRRSAVTCQEYKLTGNN